MSYTTLCKSYSKDKLSSEKYMLKMVKSQFPPEIAGIIVSEQRPDSVPLTQILPYEQNTNQCKIKRNIEWSKDPAQWGPHLWMYMHYAAANYPMNPTTRDIEEMCEWLCTLPVTIPCDSCRKHFKQYIERKKDQLPKICSNRHSLFKFLVDIHNKVNERNKKPVLQYDEAKGMYQK